MRVETAIQGKTSKPFLVHPEVAANQVLGSETRSDQCSQSGVSGYFRFKVPRAAGPSDVEARRKSLVSSLEQVGCCPGERRHEIPEGKMILDDTGAKDCDDEDYAAAQKVYVEELIALEEQREDCEEDGWVRDWWQPQEQTLSLIKEEEDDEENEEVAEGDACGDGAEGGSQFPGSLQEQSLAKRQAEQLLSDETQFCSTWLERTNTTMKSRADDLARTLVADLDATTCESPYDLEEDGCSECDESDGPVKAVLSEDYYTLLEGFARPRAEMAIPGESSEDVFVSPREKDSPPTLGYGLDFAQLEKGIVVSGPRTSPPSPDVDPVSESWTPPATSRKASSVQVPSRSPALRNRDFSRQSQPQLLRSFPGEATPQPTPEHGPSCSSLACERDFANSPGNPQFRATRTSTESPKSRSGPSVRTELKEARPRWISPSPRREVSAPARCCDDEPQSPSVQHRGVTMGERPGLARTSIENRCSTGQFGAPLYPRLASSSFVAANGGRSVTRAVTSASQQQPIVRTCVGNIEGLRHSSSVCPQFSGGKVANLMAVSPPVVMLPRQQTVGNWAPACLMCPPN
mmetsp:Transcript_13385/g.36806  ORF Transcript_13385/g.36806 Transcript_13385/m.36806 type:complete len:575 (-) Transcript_13385:432-2156(-)